MNQIIVTSNVWTRLPGTDVEIYILGDLVTGAMSPHIRYRQADGEPDGA